ncbi:MAG: flavin reductase family protein, partial [Pseudomonadota bacterium]
MSEIDPRALRDAFGAFLTGVTVVTTVGEDGAPRGFTANSFASVSLDPPLLLVCPARRLSSFAAFEGCRDFAISVLAEGQEAVSNIFASSKGDRFAEVAWRPAASGAPVIEGAAAAFACTAQSVVPAGDHVILIGRVTAFERSGRR